MRKLLPLLLLTFLLTGCSRAPLTSVVQTAPADIPAPIIDGLPENEDQATLWFRYGEEPFLAAESRAITHSRTEGHALAILRALVAGPSTASAGLNSLFPTGTQVISATQAGPVMFVTLSRHIMNSYPDEPAAWRTQTAWAIEVPLRRQLAMQSIAATITENFAVDRVVILVEQTGNATDSLRLRQDYYTLDGNMDLADPLIRDESLLLTPARTAEVILQCWQERDFARLYRYIARTDPATNAIRPDETAFLEAMAAQPHLLHVRVKGGSVSFGGQTATYTVSGAWMTDGRETPFEGMVLRLTREKGLWRVGLSQLTGREALP
ncbi:MAG: hypothetical protein E7318_09995 [Clostridiales bacterium]|nr:hypothetical protein [Clostridiales bacterium]